ncbi:MAG: hypothetical protein HOJ57_43480 [Lentisphaerae bacterium]|nr:hypothetical protein [Lentisphaerota bacterium]MBT5612877.1 hypothetical protein [Lentisphaerota bacterium]
MRISRAVAFCTVVYTCVGAVEAFAADGHPVSKGNTRSPAAAPRPVFHLSDAVIAGKAWASQEPKGLPEGTWQVKAGPEGVETDAKTGQIRWTNPTEGGHRIRTELRAGGDTVPVEWFLRVVRGTAFSTEVLSPPNYEDFQLPAAGGWFTDPVFGTRIRRITDDQSVRGFNGERAMFSSDDRFFIVWVGRTIPKLRLLDGQTGAFVKDLPLAIPDFSTVRWSYEPEMIVFPDGHRLMGYNVVTEVSRVIKEFNEKLGNQKGRLCGGDGNDFDDKGEWLLLEHDGRMFAYNLRTHERGPEKDMTGYDVDYCTMSASGQYIVGCLRKRGVVLWNRDWTDERQLLPNSPHMDIAYLNGSQECVVSRISGSRQGKDLWKKHGVDGGSLVAVRFSDGEIFEVLHSDRWFSPMISAVGGSNRQHVYLAIESYGLDPGDKWHRYFGEIVGVPLDEGADAIRRLAHHRCRTHDSSSHTFSDQPEAWINHAGDRLFFRSNMDDYTEKGRHDLFMIEL